MRWIVKDLWSTEDNNEAWIKHNFRLEHIHDGRLLIWPPAMRTRIIAMAQEGNYLCRRARAAQVSRLLELEYKRHG